MPAPRPGSLDEVGVDALFQALRLLGQPTVFYHPSADRPDTRDIPQLLGALSAAVERVAVHRSVYAGDERYAWAAGYLQGCGAAGPCGSGQAFDMITVRLRSTSMLLEGYGGAGMGAVVQLSAAATAGFATVAALAAGLSAGDGGADEDAQAREALMVHLNEAQRALTATRVMLAEVLGEVLRKAGVNAPGPQT